MMELRYSFGVRKKLYKEVARLRGLVKRNKRGYGYIMVKHLLKLPELCRNILNDIGFEILFLEQWVGELRYKSINVLNGGVHEVVNIA